VSTSAATQPLTERKVRRRRRRNAQNGDAAMPATVDDRAGRMPLGLTGG